MNPLVWAAPFLLPFIYVIGGVGIAWYAFTTRQKSQAKGRRPPAARHTIEGWQQWDANGPRRPPEFGPLLRPWAEIEHMRVAIIADQLGARHESAAQRRRRMARMEGATEQDRVLHWLAHWQDYVGSLTGRGWAFQ